MKLYEDQDEEVQVFNDDGDTIEEEM